MFWLATSSATCSYLRPLRAVLSPPKVPVMSLEAPVHEAAVSGLGHGRTARGVALGARATEREQGLARRAIAGGDQPAVGLRQRGDVAGDVAERVAVLD